MTTSADVDAYFIGLPASEVERLVGESIRAGSVRVPLPFDPHGLTFAIRELGGATSAGPWFATAFDLPNGTKLVSIAPGIPCLFGQLGPGGSRAKGFRFGADANCTRPFAELATSVP